VTAVVLQKARGTSTPDSAAAKTAVCRGGTTAGSVTAGSVKKSQQVQRHLVLQQLPQAAVRVAALLLQVGCIC
jgi:hypothetical protein